MQSYKKGGGGMKLSDTEKSILKYLRDRNFKFLTRDEQGEVVAFQHKPELQTSQDKSFKFWLPKTSAKGKVAILPADTFVQIKTNKNEPYIITKNATLRLCNPTKKAVAV